MRSSHDFTVWDIFFSGLNLPDYVHCIDWPPQTLNSFSQQLVTQSLLDFIQLFLMNLLCFVLHLRNIFHLGICLIKGDSLEHVSLC